MQRLTMCSKSKRSGPLIHVGTINPTVEKWCSFLFAVIAWNMGSGAFGGNWSKEYVNVTLPLWRKVNFLFYSQD